MNGAERDTVVGSGSLVTLDPGATKREIARSFPVRPWALSQARGAWSAAPTARPRFCPC